MADSTTSSHYLELSSTPIRFDPVSQLTSVFFDDSNKQIFAVRAGGTTGVVVKGLMEDLVISFCMNERGGNIRSIKLSPDNQLLAVQRRENSVEVFVLNGDQTQLQEIAAYEGGKAHVYGFIWLDEREIAVISSNGIELLSVLTDKHLLKPVKLLLMSINWFSWCYDTRMALVCANDERSLIPVLIKPKTITKLPRIDYDNHEIQESKITLSQIYGSMAVMILQTVDATDDLMEVEVHMVNGAQLTTSKSHVLRLGVPGRFAISAVDNLIVVHHQTTAKSLLFDTMLSGETIDGVTYLAPITPGQTIRPFKLKKPTLTRSGQIQRCELYSPHWVLFQPDVIIDAKLGCMWFLRLNAEALCGMLEDRVLLTEFLLQRQHGKSVLLNVLRQQVEAPFAAHKMLTLSGMFDKINEIYSTWVQTQLATQTALPSNVRSTPKPAMPPPTVLIEQSDMLEHVFAHIMEQPHAEAVLTLYLQSLNKYQIAAQEELSKTIISELVHNRHFERLRRLVDYSLLLESKSIACFLLSHADVNSAVSQIALAMLSKIKAHEIIIEILLGQGKVIDALRMAKNSLGYEKIPARKFLEAAQKTKDDLVFHSVFKFFQMRNMQRYETLAFPKSEQCAEFQQYYYNLFPAELQQPSS